MAQRVVTAVAWVTAVVWVRSLTRELLYAVSAARGKKKKKDRKKQARQERSLHLKKENTV